MKNHKSANNSTTTEAKEKTSPDLESLLQKYSIRNDILTPNNICKFNQSKQTFSLHA
jgi:hypothetical protein